MTLEDLIIQFREDADDLVAPYLWDSAWVTRWMDEAQVEAAIRGRLIYEASNLSVCEIAVVPGQAVYPLHPALYEIGRMEFSATSQTMPDIVTLQNREELNRFQPDWRTKTDDARIRWAIQDDKRIQLVYKPQAAGLLRIEGYRLPLKALADDGDTPEIHAAHHRHLVQWALHRAFSKPDSETVDPKRAELALMEFTRYFGARPDADMRRQSRPDQPQHNQPW